MSLQSPVAEKYSWVLSGLVSWNVYDPSIRTELTSHALKTSEGWWFVDPTPICDETIGSFLGDSPVLGILLTNENHERNACKLSQSKDLPVHAHENTLKRLENNPDYFFQHGQKLRGNVEVIHIPGATAGETCFYHSEQKLYLMGDALINLKETGFAFLPEKYCQDTVQSKKSLHLLLKSEFETMAFAHGEALTANPKKQLQELLDAN